MLNSLTGMSKWKKLESFIYGNSDFIVIVILGAYLRLTNIIRDEFWYDEAFTGLMTKIPWEGFVKISGVDPHPPFFLLLIRAWTGLVGTTDLTIRILPAVFGILTVVLVYLTSKELFDKKTAAIAGLLTAINPFLIAYSNESRSYSIFAFLAVLSLYFLARNKRSLFVVSAIAMVSIHFMGIFFLPGLAITYAAIVLKEKKISWAKEVLRVAPLLLVTVLVLQKAISAGNALGVDWARQNSFWSIPRSFTAFLFGVKSKLAGSDALREYNLPINMLFVGYALFGAFLASIFKLFKESLKDKKGSTAILFINLFLPQVLLIAYAMYRQENLYVERYLIPSGVFLMVLLGAVLVRTIKFEVMAVLLTLYVLVLFRSTNPDYYSGMKFLQENLKYAPHDIVFTKPIDYVVAKYYMYENREQLRIFDPENPSLDYSGWPFIEPKAKLSQEEAQSGNNVFVIPRYSFVPKEFSAVSTEGEYGDYSLYVFTH